jgi:hypothetical protein
MASASLDYNKFDELPELFWNKVDKTGNCWLWLGKKDDGYGRWSPPGEKPQYLVHRLSFAVLKEKIIDNLQIDHLCITRACLNPDHLEQVTTKENTRRGLAKIANTDPNLCPHGHEYDGEVLGKAPGSIYKTCSSCRKGNK